MPMILGLRSGFDQTDCSMAACRAR